MYYSRPASRFQASYGLNPERQSHLISALYLLLTPARPQTSSAVSRLSSHRYRTNPNYDLRRFSPYRKGELSICSSTSSHDTTDYVAD